MDRFWIIPIVALIVGSIIGIGAIEYKINTVWPNAGIEIVELKEMSCPEIKEKNAVGRYWTPQNGKFAREKVDVCIEAEKAEILRIKDKCEGLEHTWIPKTKTCELTSIYPNCAGLGLDDCKYTMPKYIDENNVLNFSMQYDKHGIIIDDLQRIFDWCNYQGDKLDYRFTWENNTHFIDNNLCKFIPLEIVVKTP